MRWAISPTRTCPTWGHIWSQLKYDNFPPLLLAVLRGWHALGLAGDGTGYRLLGLLVGLGILGALWGNARLLGARAPFFSLALFATGRLVVRGGGFDPSVWPRLAVDCS